MVPGNISIVRTKVCLEIRTILSTCLPAAAQECYTHWSHLFEVAWEHQGTLGKSESLSGVLTLCVWGGGSKVYNTAPSLKSGERL